MRTKVLPSFLAGWSIELCSRAQRRAGGVGEGFADSSVDTVHPYVEWLEGVAEMGIAVAARNEGTQDDDDSSHSITVHKSQT